MLINIIGNLTDALLLELSGMRIPEGSAERRTPGRRIIVT